MTNKVKEMFCNKFNGEGEIFTLFAPGRINLIGEHIDYNGGYVFPCALTIGTYGVFRKREDKILRCYSLNFEDVGVVETNIEDLVFDKSHNWVNYVKAVIWAFKQKGYEINTGFDFVCFGNIPNASGLSSSASLEILVSRILIKLNNLDVDMIEASLISQFAENKFIGVNCGIMDQFSIAMGKKDKAIFLNTNTLEYKYAPIDLSGMRIIICNTNKKRELSDSKYNERRAECEEALKRIKTIKDIKELCDLSIDEFESVKHVINDEILQKRVKHVVYENDRTKKAYEFLNSGKIEEFGKLLDASHKSLKEDYEVTGIELDTLVDTSSKQKGVIGSRMTGAGFGGCTLSIVKDENVEEFMKNVSKEYKDKIGYDCDFYIANIGGIED